MRHRERRERRERLAIRRGWHGLQGKRRLLRLAPCEAFRVVEPARRLDRHDDRVELLEPAVFDCRANLRLLFLVPHAQRVDEGQRRLAFGKVIADILLRAAGSER